MDRRCESTNRPINYITLLTLIPNLFISMLNPTMADPLIGTGAVVDGNTIIVKDKYTRLKGMDAPDLDQKCYDAKERKYNCGVIASKALEELVATQEVTCEKPESDCNGRIVMSCRVGSVDIGSWMVSHGHAVASRSGSTYATNERQAWGRRLGLWSGVFQEPNDWRSSKCGEKVAAGGGNQS